MPNWLSLHDAITLVSILHIVDRNCGILTEQAICLNVWDELYSLFSVRG